MPSAPRTLGRRAALRLVLVGGMAGLAGCQTTSDTEVSPATPTTERPTATSTPTPTPLPDPGDRVTFLDAGETEAIRAKIDAKTDPWASAWTAFQRTLPDAMNASPRSVADNGAPYGDDGDSHKYGTDAPYQSKDGVYSKDANRQDYEAAIKMSTWIRAAGLAYALTNDDRYARRAIDLLVHWCVDPDTRMVPSGVNFGPHQQGFAGNHSIELYITIPAMFYGASFIADHPYWNQNGGVDRLNEWAQRFLGSVEADGTFFPNNVGAWQIAARATVAAYLTNKAALSRAFDDWNGRVLGQVTEAGGLVEEQKRTRSLWYSIYDLKALCMTAEIARHRGVDLYGHVKQGRTESVLRNVADFHAPYLLDPSSWPHEQLSFGQREREAAASVYELLYSEWREDRYLAVVRAAGRPVTDGRLLGPVTLTHADRFAFEA